MGKEEGTEVQLRVLVISVQKFICMVSTVWAPTPDDARFFQFLIQLIDMIVKFSKSEFWVLVGRFYFKWFLWMVEIYYDYFWGPYTPKLAFLISFKNRGFLDFWQKQQIFLTGTPLCHVR